MQKGVRVAIVGRELPEDLDSAGFASPWAVSLCRQAHQAPSCVFRRTDSGQGANWSAYATNPAEQARERATFHHFDKLSKSHPGMIRRTPFAYVASTDLYGEGWYKDLVYDVSSAMVSYLARLD